MKEGLEAFFNLDFSVKTKCSFQRLESVASKIFLKSQNDHLVPLLMAKQSYTGVSSQKVFMMPLREFILFGT